MLQKNIGILILSLFFWSFSFAQNKDSLLVFVGEKIEIKHIPQPISKKFIDTIINEKDTIFEEKFVINTDSKFVAKYKVIQILNGRYVADTISFNLFVHSGGPNFAPYKHALLFVYPHKEEFYLEKYQSIDVYLTKNKRWAGAYSVIDYQHPNNSRFTVKPEIIQFIEPVTYVIGSIADSPKNYPSPYYFINSNQAKAVYGNYVEDLFKLKQQGVLKVRGYYK
ncbi:MAG: hypothetical protein EOO90_21430 [Pedobacter sp.]|nr:MAG: hypothetical protein EOO90_21430 [Pedobacter sp.]